MGVNSFAHLTSWHADWSGLKVAVLGLAETGFSVADTLAELHAEVAVFTEDAAADYARLIPVIGAKLHVTSLDTVPGLLEEFTPDLVIASPGFAPHHPVIQWTQERGIALWGDIELAWRVRDKVLGSQGAPATWQFITGTNGKTTTTQLTATLLAAGGLRAAPCGNIGIPILDAVRDPGGFDVLVVELSSHQLWYLGLSTGPGQPVPQASVCLNFAEDHLIWHRSEEAYFDAKALVYRHTTEVCAFNKADPATRRMVEEAEVTEGARAVGFGLGIPGPSDLGIVEDVVVDRAFLDDRQHTALELTTLPELAQAGLHTPHLVQNVLAAAAFARSLGVAPEAIHEALATFHVDAHRLEVIATHAGVTWVDDSKATNPHAARAALAAYPGAVWVLGGDLKGVDVTPLVAEVADSLRGAVIIGEQRDAIRIAFDRHAPNVPVAEIDASETGEVMARVVELAAELAGAEGTVLLSPVAASFDQFDSYADRGRRFAAAVRSYISEETADDPDGGVAA